MNTSLIVELDFETRTSTIFLNGATEQEAAQLQDIAEHMFESINKDQRP